MAYADKMYFFKNEYIEIKKLWLATRQKQIDELGTEIYMYPFSNLSKYKYLPDGTIDFDNYEYDYDPADSDLDIEEFSDKGDQVVFNVSTKVELWLYKNFDLDCIKREVQKQLGTLFYIDIPEDKKFNLFDELDFSVKDTILAIEDEKNNTYFYFFINDENGDLEVIEKFLVYGTTHYLKVIGDAKQQLMGYGYNGYTVKFIFCGLHLESNENGVFLNDQEVVIPFMKPTFFKPEFVHSFNLSDAKDYLPAEIIISDDKSVGTADQYHDNLARGIMGLPKYIKNFIND